MNILWIGSVSWNDGTGYRDPVKGVGAVSGSLFEQSMIEGLENHGNQVDIICSYPYGESKFYRKGYMWSHNQKSEDIVVPTLAKSYLSLVFKTYFVCKTLESYLKKKKYDCVVTYLIHQPYLRALQKAKKIDPNIKTILICPDLPDMMDLGIQKKTLKKHLKQIDNNIITNLYKYVDGFVLFSYLMAERIPINTKPIEVIEGIASIEGLELLNNIDRKKIVVYAGSLQKQMGIEQLIESMQYIKYTDIELWVFGNGELKEFVKTAASIDNRIKYKGFISRDLLFQYQQQASVLVNVRNVDADYTKYSFPSKTFEYLYSGTPFLTTNLIGIPNEYKDYLYIIDDNNPLTIANKIKDILNLTPVAIQERAKASRFFVREKKNKYQQSLKLDLFIKRVCNE